MSSRVFCSVCGCQIERSSGGFSPYSQHASAEHSRYCGRDKNAPYHCKRCNFYSDPRRFANRKVCPNCRTPVSLDWKDDSFRFERTAAMVEPEGRPPEPSGIIDKSSEPEVTKDGKKRKAPKLGFSP